MTHEQILKTALEIYNKPIKEFTREYGDIDGMMEYLDGAIGELVAEEVTKAQDQVVHLYRCGCSDPLSSSCRV